MTWVGKTLVFVILALALLQAGLHVVFHVTQTNWARSYQELDLRYKAVTAEADTLRGERDQEKDTATRGIAKVNSDLDTVKKSLDAEKVRSADLERQLATMKENANKGEANLASQQVGAQRRQDEVKRLEDTLKTRDDRIRELVDSNNQLRDRAVAAEIDSRSLKVRNKALADQLADMSKEIVRAKNGTPTGTLTAKNPPPENVEGLVTKVDASGMMTLSIGGDDGLVKGHTLEVFRLSPAKYLGTVRVISVTPHEAVAQPVSRPSGAIQQGDRVASKILGS
jgi:hypothetical protein